MATNWAKIKRDYINGEYSYRELAEKHSISASSIEKRAAREKWAATKNERLQATCKKIEEKTVEKIAEAESDVNAIMSRIRLKLTQKIEQAIDDMEKLDTAELRKLVQSYKDMTEAKNGAEEEKNGSLADILEAVRGVSND